MTFPALLKLTPVLEGELVGREWLDWLQSLGATQRAYLSVTSAERGQHPATKTELGSQLYLADWDITYICALINGEKRWKYHAGIMRGTISPDLKPTLNAEGDAGFLFWSTDYEHLYRWDGAAWDYATEAGDHGSGYVVWWDSNIPNSGVWALCDGSVVTKSTKSGGTFGHTTKNLIGAYVKGAATATARAAAVAPTITGSVAAASAGTPTGTNSAPTFTGSPGTTGSASSIGGAQPGGSAFALDHSHSFTPAGAVSAPTFTGDAMPDHTHAKGTLAVTAGEPERVELMPYIRL